MSTPHLDEPPEDLLAGAVLVEEITFGDVFRTVCRRLNDTVDSLRKTSLEVTCPSCAGNGCRECLDSGARPFLKVSQAPTARLEVGIRFLEWRRANTTNEEIYWLDWSLNTLREMLAEKMRKAKTRHDLGL